MIPFLDLKQQHASIKEEVFALLEKVYDSTAFSGGEFVEQFENVFSNYLGIDYAAGVNNGTSALHLALLSLGIGPGDEVIVPANTFIATAWAVTYTGATPVFVDCDNDSWQINPSAVEQAITGKTKAIIGVHLYGSMFDIDALSQIAIKNNLFLVEDCAQAHGAIYKGKKAGTFGDMACFSFYPSKNLGACGEAGCVVTNNKNLIEAVKRLRNQGSSEKYVHDVVGYNMRMGGMEAASLIVKLRHLDNLNERRNLIAKRYLKEIKNNKIRFQQLSKDSGSVFHLFVVTIEHRDEFGMYLKEHGIGSGMHYPVPCHLQKAYSNLGYSKGDFPNAEYLAGHCLSLPMFPELKEEEVSKIINVINNYQ